MADVQTRSITFTEAVLLRPAMYTLNGTYAEVISFLEGYYSGMARGKPDVPPAVEWSDFENWLADCLGVGVMDSFRHIERSHTDDCERLKALANWYARFQSER